MKQLITALLLYFAVIVSSHAAAWVKLNDQNTEKLMLDKQSVLQKDTLKRAWVKIEYKTPQNNPETIDKTYNSAKLLWFFDCPAQKVATAQVFQYLDNEMVYSAAIDAKSAEFIDPVPESHVDIAMRYVCKPEKPVVVAKPTKPEAEKTKPAPAKPEPAPEAAKTEKAEKAPEPPAKVATKPDVKASDDKHKTHWTYQGKTGPDNWGKLSPEFATCASGRNQSPVNIDATTHAALKPLKSIQKFAAKDIANNGHSVQVNFKEGNMLVLDSGAYQMKQVHFHSPSENTIHGKIFPLEAHFVHADSKGNLTVLAVMYTEGKANLGLAKLWGQMSKEVGEPVALKNRVTPSELIPENRSYYRYSGSLTTPPCTEGVRWLVMKNPMTASKEQIKALNDVIQHDNNRPLQALNGRIIVE
ncbi:MAG: carbonic anhydrase family protein [Sulfuritalea sp.]|nr:carbonic anhydrase family protein [Sulfuritalea sp.]